MTKRIIDIANSGAKLAVQHEQLVIEQHEQKSTVPLDEVAVLLVAHPAVQYSQAVLAGLMERGGVFIACDWRRLPAGMMLPIEGHHLQTERLRAQVAATAPMCKQIWKQIVRAKILAQAALLMELQEDDRGLALMAQRVKSGDTQNVEAQASRRYWPALFGKDFRRDRDADGINALLNYGYTVLRGIVARAVVAAGLHPSIGIHHSNRYDAFCLADDLMEHLRPLIDRQVFHCRDLAEEGLTPITKRLITQPLLGTVAINDEERSLFEVAEIAAVSLTNVFLGKRKALALPQVTYRGEKAGHAAADATA